MGCFEYWIMNRGQGRGYGEPLTHIIKADNSNILRDTPTRGLEHVNSAYCYIVIVSDHCRKRYG